ncbi:MAG: hypothetical protein AAF823_03520 [Planctomycetota bacterium]
MSKRSRRSWGVIVGVVFGVVMGAATDLYAVWIPVGAVLGVTVGPLVMGRFVKG